MRLEQPRRLANEIEMLAVLLGQLGAQRARRLTMISTGLRARRTRSFFE